MVRGKRSVISLGILVLTYFLPQPALSQPAVVQKPKAVVENAEFDWGSISQGGKVAHDFTLKNGGDAELIIQRIVPSCGCTATSTAADHIPAGGTTTIHVEVDTAGFSGQKNKSVRLFTNDPDSPYTALSLKGAVEPDVTVEPQRLAFPEIVRGELKQPPSLEFDVKVRPGSSVQIKEISTFSKFLSLKEIAAGDKARRVQVTLDPQVPTGEFRDRVVVTLGGGTLATINVPVLASIRGRVQLKPSTLSFGVIEGQKLLVKKVRVENSGGENLGIKSITSDSSAVTAQFNVVKPGKIFDIQVTVDPAKVTKDLRATLSIETDSTTEGSLSLSVYGILPPKR